jgi:hypothetical protein
VIVTDQKRETHNASFGVLSVGNLDYLPADARTTPIQELSAYVTSAPSGPAQSPMPTTITLIGLSSSV